MSRAKYVDRNTCSVPVSPDREATFDARFKPEICRLAWHVDACGHVRAHVRGTLLREWENWYTGCGKVRMQQLIFMLMMREGYVTSTPIRIKHANRDLFDNRFENLCGSAMRTRRVYHGIIEWISRVVDGHEGDDEFNDDSIFHYDGLRVKSGWYSASVNAKQRKFYWRDARSDDPIRKTPCTREEALADAVCWRNKELGLAAPNDADDLVLVRLETPCAYYNRASKKVHCKFVYHHGETARQQWRIMGSLKITEQIAEEWYNSKRDANPNAPGDRPIKRRKRRVEKPEQATKKAKTQ